MARTDFEEQSTPLKGVCFDRAAEIYDATRGFPPGIPDRVARLIVQTAGLTPSDRVLEIGIGTGRIARPLAGHVRGIVGVDLSRAMMRRLVDQHGAETAGGSREGGWIELALADAGRLPFPDDCFDAAIGVHVFHLIPNWRGALAEVARVLRPGAHLINAADIQRMPEVWQHWREHTGRERVVPEVGLSWGGLEAGLDDAGWQTSGPKQEIRFTETVDLQRYLEQFRQRSWSSTWRLGEAELDELVAVLREALIELYGSVDRSIESETGFWATAYRPPSQASKGPPKGAA